MFAFFNKTERAALPQEIINQHAANGGSLWEFTDAQMETVPVQIKEVTTKAAESMILYAAGKIPSGELPADVYANYRARITLLEIIKHKTINKFKELCESAGYDVDEVPEEVKLAFDERLSLIGQEVEEKKKPL